MSECVDDARVACPLFQAEYGGSTPTSALQLKVAKISLGRARELNRKWHSRLPEIVNWQACEAYGAEYNNVLYAIAIWGPPVARAFNHQGVWELRRMAIAGDAPRNTASRMLAVMRRMIMASKAGVIRLISYQDTEVHTGCIYRAAGWRRRHLTVGDDWQRPNRYRRPSQTTAPKIRWELALSPVNGK